ncbi:MAG TPA: phosphoribosylformylglycinamidine cyclo-ligase [Candidatus Saccharimonadales bacterium]|nr:phosphoribosylformylglycinamidine cyclo-ligase [Candidatus Saccharimonadales bacterium]
MRYADAGVDRERAARARERIGRLVRSTWPVDLGRFGGFSGAFPFPGDPERLLTATLDGVGTKIRLAVALGRHRGIGADLVNHCVNDTLAHGATPLFLLDYFAAARLEPAVVGEVLEGAAEACRAEGVAILGGETAELPGLYSGGDYDFAGCLVGWVRRADWIDGRDVRAGDAVVGLPSSGLHTNGYSLVRALLAGPGGPRLEDPVPGTATPLGEALLAPHRSYSGAVRALGELRPRALAHITGGGFTENLPRVIPAGLGAELEPWPLPPLFEWIRRAGRLDDAEMRRVFNLGYGLVLVLEAARADAAEARLRAAGEAPRRLGRVVEGEGVRFLEGAPPA